MPVTAKLSREFYEKLGDKIAEVRWSSQTADLKASLIKWMFVFWVGTTVTVLGTTLAILKL